MNETNNESIETHGTVRLLAVRCMAYVWRAFSDDDRQVFFFFQKKNNDLQNKFIPYILGLDW